MSDIRRTRAEAFRHTQGTDALNYAPLNVTRVLSSDDGLYAVVKARLADGDVEAPTFLERLRLAENEAEDWLDEHGRPEPDVLPYDDDEAWDALDYEWRPTTGSV